MGFAGRNAEAYFGYLSAFSTGKERLYSLIVTTFVNFSEGDNENKEIIYFPVEDVLAVVCNDVWHLLVHCPHAVSLEICRRDGGQGVGA